jgi:hypothetical protein
MNYQAMVLNCLTSGYPEGRRLLVHFDSDREVIDAAPAIRHAPADAASCTSEHARGGGSGGVRALPEQADRQTDFTVESGPYELTFDAQGNLAGLE